MRFFLHCLDLPPPSTRERPPGCKTVFVGGLPENATEEIIREVFDQCGEITAIRKSKKNFCHIRFTEEFMVDKAIYLSGYRMRIGSSTDKKDSGRLHVDFAQARDDFYEWECMQRLLAREERHRRKIEEERLRPPSPPPIMHFSEHEAGLLAEKLKDDSKFMEAIAVLVTWIDRGEVNRRSANHFYSMVQSANSHVRRLMNEKAIHEEEMELAKERFRDSLLGILTQFEQIVAVFAAATRQRAWDHFSKAQRKNIDIWRKQCEELRNAHSEELMGIRREEEMEMSEDESEENPNKKIKMNDSALAAQAYALKEENDSLRWQLDAYRNEVELLRQEQGKACRTEEDHTKEHQLHFLQQTMQGMQQQLVELQGDLQRKESELEHAREEQRCMEVQLIALKEKVIKMIHAVQCDVYSMHLQ
ncbi:ecto-NOX disulfide-thiol exchanger 1 isoform X1 [Huso huso]|uniref:Ecto-NOX disulfide-thiol exchanger 1 isoform X1 n=1 Tax=Huso huso TaxID=61971 RepID=A0ABR0ZQV2_HUSHU